jgi:nucleoid-associated protein
MAFSAIIAHRIQRDAPGSSINTKIRTEEFASTGVLDEFAYDLKGQFIRKSGKQYGRFANETIEFPFSAWLKEYREGRLGFASFTQKAMQHFKSTLDNSEILLDAYVFFVLEKIEAGEFLHIYIVEHMSGLYLDSDIAIADSRYLDIAGLGLAAKINLNEWDAGESLTYLALLRTRGEKDFSDAFATLVGFSDKHDVKSDTVEFLQIVDNFNETLDEDTARVTRTKVVNYCLEQNKAGKAVVIAELSENLSQEIKSYEPERFVRFVEAAQPDIKGEFIPDSNQLRSYVRISGRNDSLSMSFASDCLGKEVLYDPANDVLTIKNIPPALKARLLKHLQSS